MSDFKIKITPVHLLIYLSLFLTLITQVMSVNLNILSLLIITLYLIFLWKNDYNFFIVNIFIIFTVVLNIIGVFSIESDNFYLSEINRMSYFANSFNLLIFSDLIFFEFCRMYWNRNRILNSQNINENMGIRNKYPQFYSYSRIGLISLHFVVLLILLIIVFKNPFFRVGLDRFTFAEKYLSGVSKYFVTLLTYLFISTTFFYFKKRSNFLLSLLLGTFIFYFLAGHKFGIYTQMISFMIIIYYFVQNKKFDKRTVHKILMYLVPILFLIVGVVFFQNMVLYGRSFAETKVYFLQRLAQQGQVWWANYTSLSDISVFDRVGEIGDEIRVFFGGEKNLNFLYSSGIYKLMRQMLTTFAFETKVILSNSRFAYSTPASIYYYFGGIGLVVYSAFAGIIYERIICAIGKSIRSENVLGIIILVRIHNLLLLIITQSDFRYIFSFEMLFYLIIYIFTRLMRKEKLI